MNHSPAKRDAGVACAIIEHGLEPELAALMPGIGILCRF